METTSEERAVARQRWLPGDCDCLVCRLCRDVGTLVGALSLQEDKDHAGYPAGVFRCPVCRFAAEEGQCIDHEEGCTARAVLGE